VKPPIITAVVSSTRREIKGGWREERGLGTGRPVLSVVAFQGNGVAIEMVGIGMGTAM